MRLLEFMKIKTPIKRHSGLPVVVSQPYGNRSLNSWYQFNGVNFPFHNGIDLVLDANPAKTYGTPCVACFDGVVVKTRFDTPLSPKGNGITIESDPFEEDGFIHKYQAVYWHLSEIDVSLGQRVRAGDIIGYVGNSGLVNPPPTQQNVFGGAHLHFMIFQYTQRGAWFLDNCDNGVGGAIDPLPLIDDLQGEEGKDPGISKDAPAIQYFFPSLWDKIKKALGL